jgi:polar amino acid transport system substrate-binding protein
MRCTKNLSIIYALVFLLVPQKSFDEQKNFILSVGDLPNKEHIVFANSMAKIFSELYPGKKMTIEVYPLARSIQNVVSGEADAHMPLLRSGARSEKGLNFSYSSSSYTKVVVVIYSNKGKQITREELREAKYSISEALRIKLDPSTFEKLRPLLGKAYSNKETLEEALKKNLSTDELKKYEAEILRIAYPYNVGTPLVGEDLFEFPISTQTSIEGAMRMVNSGRLDTMVMTQDEGDNLTRRLKLKNIHRSLYGILPVHFVVAKNVRGQKADETLTKILEEMKKRGTFKKQSQLIHQSDSYSDWQP